jgi:hypothetical protein
MKTLHVKHSQALPPARRYGKRRRRREREHPGAERNLTMPLTTCHACTTEPEETVACSECDIWYALLYLHQPVTRAATPPTTEKGTSNE